MYLLCPVKLLYMYYEQLSTFQKFNYVLFYTGKYKVVLRNCSDDMGVSPVSRMHKGRFPRCTENVNSILNKILKLNSGLFKIQAPVHIRYFTGKWCACFHSECNKMTVSELEASLSFPSRAESTINNVITGSEFDTSLGFPVATHSSINNVVDLSELEASLPVLPTTQAPIKDAVTVGELEAALDSFTTTHSMDNNVTIGVKSLSPNILLNGKLFASILSALYFTI